MDVYEAIYSRRDVRDFSGADVSDEILGRILDAAHHAGSVGLMLPWNFIVVRSSESRRRIAESSECENARAAENYSGERRKLYDSIRSNPIVNSALNIAVTCDRNRGGPHVYGRNSILDTDLYSTCCAIQNLWLAARAEGIGMCWMSILDPEIVKSTLCIPPEVVLVGYLCLGYPREFDDRPHLERIGWESRTPLQEVVYSERWAQPGDFHEQGLPASGEGAPCRHEH